VTGEYSILCEMGIKSRTRAQFGYDKNAGNGARRRSVDGAEAPKTNGRGAESESVRNLERRQLVASIHPFELTVIEFRLGVILPFLQTLGIHPYLHRTVNANLLLPFTDRFWNFAALAMVHPPVGLP